MCQKEEILRKILRKIWGNFEEIFQISFFGDKKKTSSNPRNRWFSENLRKFSRFPIFPLFGAKKRKFWESKKKLTCEEIFRARKKNYTTECRSVRNSSSLAGLYFVSRTRFGAATQLLARRERKGKEGNKIKFWKFSGDPSKSVIFAGACFKTDRNPVWVIQEHPWGVWNIESANK